jgi:hypothetical protein
MAFDERIDAARAWQGPGGRGEGSGRTTEAAGNDRGSFAGPGHAGRLVDLLASDVERPRHGRRKHPKEPQTHLSDAGGRHRVAQIGTAAAHHPSAFAERPRERVGVLAADLPAIFDRALSEGRRGGICAGHVDELAGPINVAWHTTGNRDHASRAWRQARWSLRLRFGLRELETGCLEDAALRSASVRRGRLRYLEPSTFEDRRFIVIRHRLDRRFADRGIDRAQCIPRARARIELVIADRAMGRHRPCERRRRPMQGRLVFRAVEVGRTIRRIGRLPREHVIDDRRSALIGTGLGTRPRRARPVIARPCLEGVAAEHHRGDARIVPELARLRVQPVADDVRHRGLPLFGLVAGFAKHRLGDQVAVGWAEIRHCLSSM